MNVQASVEQRGKNLGLPAEGLATLKHHASKAQALLDELKAAAASGKYKEVRRLSESAMSSYDLKVCSAIRGLRGSKKLALADIERRARALRAFRPIKERVVAHLIPKDVGPCRVVVDFGWQRRALIDMAVCVLDAVFPRFDFDFLDAGAGGYDAATLHLRDQIAAEGHEFVVTVDIKECFRSATKEKVVNLLPFPAKVTRNVLLIGEGVEIQVKLPKGMANDSLTGIAAINEADEAARQGLPQGSPASGLIMRRAVLGPVLAQQAFSHDLALYQDEVAVGVKTQAEAGATLEVLKSMLSTSPAGPLAIGHHCIKHISEGFTFLPYHMSKTKAGRLHIKPSLRSFARAENKAVDRYLEAGAGAGGLKAVVLYVKSWRRSLRLWNANWFGKWYQWIALFAGSWHKGGATLKPSPKD